MFPRQIRRNQHEKTKYIAPLLSLAILFPTASNVYSGRHNDEDLNNILKHIQKKEE